MTTQLTASDAAWVRLFAKREAEGFAPIRGARGKGGKQNVLALIRAVAPNAYAAIIARPAVMRSVRQPDSGFVIEVAE